MAQNYTFSTVFVPQQSLLRVLHFDCNFLSCHTAVRSGKVGTHCHPNLLAGEDWNSPEMWKTSGCGADCHGSFGTAALGHKPWQLCHC